MNDPGYWVRHGLSRRSVLRGAGVGFAGLAGAALIGCGSSDSTKSSGSPAASNTGGGAGAAADSGIPKNIKRAPGLNPQIGTAPINTKKVVPGGTYRRAY